VVDGCVVVDLSQLNQIIEVNESERYALIEPGVTQGQLAEYLSTHHPRLTFNVTGSFSETSIVGNVLDRGDGAYARIDDLLGVKGVLGSGEPFAVGGVWAQEGSGGGSHVSRYVAGPDLAGEFSQANFGIVTLMAFRLLDKPERRYLFWGSAEDRHLERLTDEFDRLTSQGILRRGGVNIGYANRFMQGAGSLRGGAGGDGSGDVWNFYAVIDGTRRVADAVVAELDEVFAAFCSVGQYLVVSDANPAEALPPFLRPLAGPLTGRPDGQTLKMIYQLTGTPLPERQSEMDADHTPFGMKCCIPLIPTRGEHTRRAAVIVRAIRERTGLNIKVSFFGDGRTLITIHFDTREERQIKRAEEAEAALWDDIAAAGYFPYRLSIDQMKRAIAQRPEFFAMVRRLKDLFDPNGIIAPGRYCPLARTTG